MIHPNVIATLAIVLAAGGRAQGQEHDKHLPVLEEDVVPFRVPVGDDFEAVLFRNYRFLTDKTGAFVPHQPNPQLRPYDPKKIGSTDMIWLRVDVENPHSVEKTFYFYHGDRALEIFNVYFPDSAGRYTLVKRSGAFLRLAQRAVPSVLLAIPVTLAPNQSQTLWVQLRNPVGGTGAIIDVLSPLAHQKLETTTFIYFSLFYGGLIIMLLFNLFMGSALKTNRPCSIRFF